MSADRHEEERRQRLAQDLEDIRVLRQNEAFNRYWLRNLARKRDETRGKFEDEPPEKCSKDERETLRRLLKSYEELLGMMDVHEKVAKGELGSSAQRTTAHGTS